MRSSLSDSAMYVRYLKQRVAELEVAQARAAQAQARAAPQQVRASFESCALHWNIFGIWLRC